MFNLDILLDVHEHPHLHRETNGKTHFRIHWETWRSLLDSSSVIAFSTARNFDQSLPGAGAQP